MPKSVRESKTPKAATTPRADRPLSPRDLNRATLARQMLLAREKVPVVKAVERAFALQAQWPKPPFVALWTRLHDFKPEHLADALLDRKLVRATLFRGTIHTVTPQTYADTRPLIQDVLTKACKTLFKGDFDELDLPAILARARELLHDHPRTFTELRELLQQTFPKVNDRLLGFSVRMNLPLVMAPDDSRWAHPQDAAFALADEWIGAKIETKQTPADLVLRHLSILGPASVVELQAWLGIPNLKPVVESLRPKLIALRDEKKRELFDLPDAPRPGGDVEAPVRLLAEFDNPLNVRADERFVATAHRKQVYLPGLRVAGTFLVDGFVAGAWVVKREKKVAAITLTPFGKLDARSKKALEAEADPLCKLLEPEAKDHEVRFAK
ncbi:MAG: AlkZ family DNA glycosylase [Deltaproteobacteria bacterium]|nr:AlkZ family DNA glycosylase [Deltaproteobacteria bacterium]